MTITLPVNQTLWERALERVSAERYPLDADIIRRAKDPWECPPELLAYLAYELSVDLWDEQWPLAKKRSVIARSIGLSRIKGTEAAIREAVGIMDGNVLSVIVPPDSLFLSVTRTPEEKAAWLAKMPQLRVYPRRMPATFAGFHVGAPLAGAFPLVSDAFFHATPRTTIWRKGVETELLTLERRREDPTITEAEELVEAREPGASAGFHIGQSLSGFTLKSTAAQRVYTVRTRTSLTIPRSDHLAAEFAGPSLDPVDVRAESIREPAPMFGLWSRGAIPGSGVSRFMINSRARLHVFKRIHLYDPDVPGAAHSGRTYLGYNFRFGQPAYTAEIKVDITQKRPPAAFSPLVYGFMTAPNQERKRAVTEAIITHKSLRDKIYLDTRTKDVLTAGLGVVAGQQVTAGQIVAL